MEIVRTRHYSLGLLGAGLVLAVACACSQSPPDAAASHTPSSAPNATAAASTSPLFVSGDECVMASGHDYAQRGDLSVGPFFADAINAPNSARATAAKVWVASQRDGRDDALLTVTSPDGATERQTRKSGEAFVETAKQFYPGTIHLSGSGPYRIDVRVGPDHLCAIVDYRVE